MNAQDEQDESINRFLQHGEGEPDPNFTARTLDRIGETRASTGLHSPARWLPPLAACLVAVLVLPGLLTDDEAVPTATPAHNPAPDEFAFDDLLLLAEPLENAGPLLDEESLDLLTMLAD